jgi:hypothetical protein
MSFNATLANMFFGFFTTVGDWFLFDLIFFAVLFITIGIYELTIRR